MQAPIVGFGLGFAVALQLGPMSLFLIRSTLRGGWRVGVAVGAGIAVVDALYAACGVAGAAPLLTLASVRAQVFTSNVSIYKAMGGGWVDLADKSTAAGKNTPIADRVQQPPPLF